MTRILAFTLALIIGMPNCWCCLLKPVAVQGPRHDCCMRDATGAEQCSLSKGRLRDGKTGDPCSCDLSKTKREMNSSPVSLPVVHFTYTPPFEPEPVILLPAGLVPTKRWTGDDGPPHHKLPVFARHCVLRC